MHRYILNKNSGSWMVICEKEKKDFSTELNIFNDHGICPYCSKNASEEIENRKRRQIENDRLQRIKEIHENKKSLKGYF